MPNIDFDKLPPFPYMSGWGDEPIGRMLFGKADDLVAAGENAIR